MILDILLTVGGVGLGLACGLLINKKSKSKLQLDLSAQKKAVVHLARMLQKRK